LLKNRRPLSRSLSESEVRHVVTAYDEVA
jgi:hypothetical protein